MATTAAQVKTAYKAIHRIDLNDAVAQATAEAINNGVTTLEAYIGVQLEATVSTTQAGVAISAFVIGKTPTAAKLDELKVLAEAQVASYADMGVGNPALGAYEAFGKGFAETAEFKAKYSALSTADFINSVYSEIFGKVPSEAAFANLNSQVEYFTNLYTGAGLDNAVDMAKGAVLGQIVGYAFVSDAKADAQIDNQVAKMLTDAANGVEGVYDAPLPGGSKPGQTFSLTAGPDSIVGTSGNDTINGLTVNAGGTAATTVSAFDSIDGGEGVDTLNIFADGANNVSLPASVTIKNVEVINLNNSTAAFHTGTLGTVDASKFVGATAINQAGLAAANLTNLAATTTAGFKNVVAPLSVTIAPADAATSATIALDAIAEGSTLNVTATATGTLNSVVVSGTVTDTDNNKTVANTNLGVKVGKDVQTLSVTTAVATNLTIADGAGTKKLTSIDASASTGAITYADTETTVASIKTGSGKDAVTVRTATLKDDAATTAVDETVSASVESGAGDDTININTAGTGTTTVNAGEGNDKVTLNTDGDGKLTVNLGAGDDSFATAGAGVVVATDAIDGGDASIPCF